MDTYSIAFLYRVPGGEFIPIAADPNGAIEVKAEEKPVNADVTGARVTALTAVWENVSKSALSCQLEIRVKTDFKYTHYVIPAVVYNGNSRGEGKEPKGLALEGKPWVFNHRRTSIPACTVSENKDRFFAMFASDKDAASLNASCGMLPCEDGAMRHRVLYPDMETPVVYRNRDRYADAHEDWITLAPGDEYRTTVFLMTGTPEKENYATAQAEDAALALLGGDFAPRFSPEALETLCCEFAQGLLTEKDGLQLICTGMRWDGHAYSHRVDFEFGWCGQNGMYARHFIERGYETGDDSLRQTGIAILDFWAEHTGKTGLVYTNYNGELVPNETADTCNLSYVIAEFAKAYRYLAEKGIKKEAWMRAAVPTADFLISRYSEKTGFGKLWNTQTGECAASDGTIGAFMIPALCELYETTGNETYMAYAKKACRFYRDRDLSKFFCTAGALDTCCIDKETAWPLLSGSLKLYAAEGDGEWLDCAKMAGWYFCSWMFHHDTLPVPGSDFEAYGFRTLGGTSVSAQHHHLDPWGAFAVPEMLLLWQFTGDRRWKRRAELMWANAIQNIAPAEGKLFHGHPRPAGAQNEGYFHCRWGGDHAPGEINEWLVSWPQAFIWNTAAFLRDHTEFRTEHPLERMK